MNSQVKTLGLRLAGALGFDVDEEYFTDDVAWALLARLESSSNQGKKLDAGALRAIEELSIMLNVRGGDEALFLQALEAQLGPSPFPVETIISIVKYIRAQLHFSNTPPKVQLNVREAYVPLKNYDFE